MSRPQDLPGGLQQLKIAVALSFVTYVLALSSIQGIGSAMQHAVVDLLCSGLFFYVAAHLTGRVERFPQAYGALCGAGAVINTAAIPIFLSRPSPPADTPGTLALLAEFLLLVWSLSLFSHVFRHTFEVSKLVSAVVAFSYVMLLISVMDLLVPTAAPVAAIE